MTHTLPNDDRFLDLLAARATQGLTPAEHQELLDRCRQAGLPDIPDDFDTAAAAFDLAHLDSQALEVMPAALRMKMLAQTTDTEPVAAPRSLPFPPARPSQSLLPWLLAAACLALAAIGWLVPGGAKITSREDLIQRVAASPDALQLPWATWEDAATPAAVTGVSGEVVWSESLQSGYMRFSGLPANDPEAEQYQLWIIDERGMEQRISGALFDATSGTLTVPITPGIAVRNAAAFAVTIEQPGGAWVSDMKRRVVIAAKG